MPFATPRPVTATDPAGFVTGRVGKAHPDYGCVFFEHVARGNVAYSFDRHGLEFARLIPSGPIAGGIEVQGRLFRIAGPVDQKAAA